MTPNLERNLILSHNAELFYSSFYLTKKKEGIIRIAPNQSGANDIVGRLRGVCCEEDTKSLDKVLVRNVEARIRLSSTKTINICSKVAPCGASMKCAVFFNSSIEEFTPRTTSPLSLEICGRAQTFRLKSDFPAPFPYDPGGHTLALTK